MSALGGSDGWFELRKGDGPPVHFVERRKGGRRRTDRMVGQLPPPELPSPTVSVIIPTRNEARNVADVLDHLPDMVTEVVLVDTRSTDVTKLMARASRPNIRIIDVPAPGKGNALRAGLAAASGDVLVAMDADGSMSPEEITRFVHPLQHGFDFTKGSRFMAGGGSLDITQSRKLGNRALVTLVNILFRVHYTDLCYGFFAVRRIFVDALDLHAGGFEIETEITIRAQRIGLRIAEVPSVELPRRSGKSGLRGMRDGLRILRTIQSQYRDEKAYGRHTSIPEEHSEVTQPQSAASPSALHRDERLVVQQPPDRRKRRTPSTFTPHQGRRPDS